MKNVKNVISIVLVFLIIIISSSCSNTEQSRTHRLQWWLEAINWDLESRIDNLSGEGIRIGIIDTAIDESHPDLIGKNIEQYFIEDSEDDLRLEHGTAVAGIIGATPNNEDGILGVAPNADFISIVISNNNETTVDNLTKGIEYAIQNDVDIINVSAGIIEDIPKLKTAIDNAYKAGIVIVAASGNDLYGRKMYPAKYDNVISVNSIDQNGKKIYGQDSQSVFLPGGNIVTTYSSKYEPKKYVSFSGTSMSAPMLTGVIALIIEENPDITNKEITEYFKDYNNAFDTIKVLQDFKKLF